MTYRRPHDETVWHGCTNCTGWPQSSFEETTIETVAWPRCVVCEMKMQVGTCTNQD